jgi:uncharacterized damage-inducible protein DinB
MNRINSNVLISRLQSDVRKIILLCHELRQQPANILEQEPAADRWSVAQVLEHLNIYARYYGGAIEKKLHLHQTIAAGYFTSGWLGNYFTKIMEPQDDGTVKRKMKSPGNARPSTKPDSGDMLTEFLQHQYQLLNLLEISRQADLNKIRVPTSLHSFIKLKMGDTFSFLIAHEQRHFLQILKSLQEVKAEKFGQTTEQSESVL